MLLGRECKPKAYKDSRRRAILPLPFATPTIKLVSVTAGIVLACSLTMAESTGPETRSEVISTGNTATGILEGKLTDDRSVPLRQTTITLRNLTTGSISKAVTSKNGSYRLLHLALGEYRLEADSSELGKGSVEGITISAGHVTRVQTALVLERVNPTALIENDGLGIDPVAAAVTTMISSDELNALPIASRDWQGFEALTPGANPDSAEPEQGNELDNTPSSASSEDVSRETGSIPSASRIDGMDSSPSFHNPSDHSNSGGGSLGESAIQTFQTRAADAPADENSSVSLTTARGHNGFHGQAFYLDRLNVWAAQNPFTQLLQETSPATGIETAQFGASPYTPSNTRQTIGLGVGRQIKSGKLYWFAALDGLLRNYPGVATVRHPTEFFARPTDDELQVLAARLDLTDAALLEEAVSAYSTGLEQLASLLGPVPRSSKQWQGFGRTDWKITERENLAVDANLLNLNAPSGTLSRSSQTYGSHSFGNSKASEIWTAANLQSFLSPDLLNSLAVQYRWHIQSETAQTPSAFEAPLIANQWNQLPEIVADSTYGFILGKPARLGGSKNPEEQSYVLQESLSWVKGEHLLKIGGSLDHIADRINTLVNQTGTYSYANVLNFISDTASFEKYGFNDIGNGFSGEHNCDATGKVHSTGGVPSGLGYLPCYAWYSQRIGPSNWSLSTNDLTIYASDQWQPLHNLTISVGLREQAEQLPKPIALVANSDIPATGKFPAANLQYGPRFGIAWSPAKSTVLRAGAGLYVGRIDNSTVLAALTQTGSPNGDLNFFFKPTDNSAPPFPYVFPTQPQTVVAPGAVSFADHFRQQQIDQAIFSIEQELPSHWVISANAMASLGRHLPISIDTNLSQPLDANGVPQTITYNVVDPLSEGPIKAAQVTVPFYTARLNPQYQQLASIESRANSTYDAALIKIVRHGGHGFDFRAHYLYAHATDWNPNESGQVAANDVLDPADFRLEYGTSNLDVRHSAAFTALYQTPWKLNHAQGYLVNHWSIAAVGQYRSGLPYTIRTGGYIPGFYEPLLAGGFKLTQGVGPGMNGSAGDNRLYGIGRNTYRYPATYTGDARIAKRFDLSHNRQLEFLAESFNLFNHQNVTLIETTGYTVDRGTATGSLPTLRFLTGLTSAGLPSPTSVEFGKPLDVNATNFYLPREFQFGLRTRF